MEEVIAERKKGLVAGNAVTIAFAAAFAVAVALLAPPSGVLGIIFGVLAALVAVVIIVFAARAIALIVRTPKVIAVREGSELVFLGRRTPLTAVAEVNYHFARGQYSARQTWGRLTVILTDGRTLSCDFVAHVDRVQDRLLALKYEYAAKGAATNS